MKHHICRGALLALLVLFAGGTPAFGEITASQFTLPATSGRNALAFDKVNQVYLLTLAGHPAGGQFLNTNGQPIGAAFGIASASEGSFVSWPTVSFGGPANDPVFLVTYVAVEGSRWVKYGRLVRYVNGAAQVSGRSLIADVNGEWFASEKAQSTWFVDHFIVATRIGTGSLPQPFVHRFEVNGAVSAGQWLGDSLDFEGSASLACAPSGVCMATGFAGAYPFGNGGSAFARLFDATTLQPLTGLFYLDDHSSRMDDPVVMFHPQLGQFLTVWYQANYAQFRRVATNGSMGPYGPAFGPGAGDIALRYNANTGTTLLVTKWANPNTPPDRWADLYAVELQGDSASTAAVIAYWDGRFPEYWTAVAADELNGRWLVTSRETAGGRGALVQGGSASQSPTVTQHPTTLVARPGHSAGLVAAATAAPAATVQWQYSVDGGATWTNISGATNPSYAFSASLADNGRLYRAVFVNSAGTTATNAAAVIVTAAVADFDGNGKQEVSVYRPSSGTWYGLNQPPVQFGARNDIPVSGDFDGDGNTDVAVFRPSGGLWYVRNQFSLQFGDAGDIPVPADYNGDGVTDIAVYRPSNGVWYVRNQFAVQWGAADDVPVPGDYNGDGTTDVGVYRPSNGVWYVRNQFTVQWGAPGDIPVPGPYDGDRTTDVAVWRPSSGTWYVRNQFTRVFGGPGDLPIVLDVDGDGRVELTVFQRATGTWFQYNVATGSSTSTQYGAPGDIPLGILPAWRPRIAADLDGDGRSDLTVYRSLAGWLTAFSGGGTAQNIWGAPGDVPAAADFDGDRRMDLVVYRPTTGTWHLAWSSTNFQTSTVITWGGATDIPVPADYDGDGRADVAVFTPSSGVWSILLSSGGTRSVQWGADGDVPVVGDYDGDGRADPAVYRPSGPFWYVRLSSTNYVVTRSWQWGINGDQPVVGDFDGDGRIDLTIFRPSSGLWYVAFSATNFTSSQIVQWGASGDIPAPLDSDGDGTAEIAIYRPSSGTWHVRSQFWIQWGIATDTPIVR